MTTLRSTREAVTQLLGEWSSGNEKAMQRLFPLVHPELHRLAHYYIEPGTDRPYATNDRSSKRSVPTAR